MQVPPIRQPSDRSGRQPGAGRTPRRLIVGLAVAAALGAAAYVSMLPLGGSPTTLPGPGASLFAVGPAEGVAIGESAPDFLGGEGGHEPLLNDLDGKPIRLHDFAGKPVWIVFWATWCTPCQQEASDIRAAFHAHRGDGLAVLAIDIQEPAVAVREYAAVHDLDYTIGLDPTAAVKALYGGWGLPSHFFLDRNGVMRDRYLGQLTAELMEQHLRTIIGS
jgi:cytochrome c biogenesis protein CcmG/thiol:disulfide interchange protein DsbE